MAISTVNYGKNVGHRPAPWSTWTRFSGVKQGEPSRCSYTPHLAARPGSV
jgi:hypothetical protein